MDDLLNAKQLLTKNKYREAGLIIDSLLRKDKENDELWYLRGVVSLKSKNYEAAQESFERARWIKKKMDYFKIMGMAHLEIFELEDAIEDFETALEIEKNDAELYFFIAICYILLNDLRFRDYMQKAYLLNKKRTKDLLKNFYNAFLKNDDTVNRKTKDEIEKKIEKIIA